jgi:anti-sigma factor RsiW
MASHLQSEKCKEIFALLSDYLNLELPADACSAIETHLAGCAPCVAFAESLRKTVELCRRFQPKELPAAIRQPAREQLLEAYRKALAARGAQDAS